MRGASTGKEGVGVAVAIVKEFLWTHRTRSACCNSLLIFSASLCTRARMSMQRTIIVPARILGQIHTSLERL